MTLEQIRALGKDDFLNVLGLETRRTYTDYLGPALAAFGVGMAVGAGMGLLLAPRSGKETRKEISQGIQHAPEAIAALPQRAASAVKRASEQMNDAVHDSKLLDHSA